LNFSRPEEDPAARAARTAAAGAEAAAFLQQASRSFIGEVCEKMQKLEDQR